MKKTLRHKVYQNEVHPDGHYGPRKKIAYIDKTYIEKTKEGALVIFDDNIETGSQYIWPEHVPILKKFLDDHWRE